MFNSFHSFVFHAYCAYMQRVNQNLIPHVRKDNFRLKTRAVKRIRGCVADCILVVVYYPKSYPKFDFYLHFHL